MKRLSLLALSMALLAGTAIQANAQPRYDQRQDQRFEQGRPGQDRPGQGRPDEHRFDHHDEHSDWREGRRMDRRDWDRGERIDYRQHNLQRPRSGYEWRVIDGRYVLAAVATGLVASIIFNGR